MSIKRALSATVEGDNIALVCFELLPCVVPRLNGDSHCYSIDEILEFYMDGMDSMLEPVHLYTND